LVLSEGQRNDSKFLEAVLDSVAVRRGSRGRPRKRPDVMYLDKGFSYPECRALLRKRGIRTIIPERQDQLKNRQKKGSDGGRPCAYDHAGYALRNVVERCALRLQWFRRVATRYDKRAENYLTFVTIAAIMLWLR
jgi:transposase